MSTQPQPQPKEQISVVSAPPAIPTDPEARRAWYRSMRERMSKSHFAVEKIPAGYTPYWARKDDEVELARLDVLGFKVVRDDPKHPRYRANGLRADGTYIMGDVILMEVPTELYAFYEQENLDRARMMVEGVPQQFISEAEKAGAPAFEIDENHNKKKG
jgi:hypothetical protein